MRFPHKTPGRPHFARRRRRGRRAARIVAIVEFAPLAAYLKPLKQNHFHPIQFLSFCIWPEFWFGTRGSTPWVTEWANSQNLPHWNGVERGKGMRASCRLRASGALGQLVIWGFLDNLNQ